MKLISLHESEPNLHAIDALVEQGVFTSRSDVYRTGALLMLSLEGARRLAGFGKLERELLDTEVKRSLDALDGGDTNKTRSWLRQIEGGLRLRATLTPLLGQTNKDSFETMADSMSNYEQVLAGFGSYTPDVQNTIKADIRRDLGALQQAIQTTKVSESISLAETIETSMPVELNFERTLVPRPWRKEVFLVSKSTRKYHLGPKKADIEMYNYLQSYNKSRLFHILKREIMIEK